MASVIFPVNVGGDGSTVTDDSNASTGLANGGHRTRFVPALAQVVAVAEYVVDTASALNQGQTWAFDSSTTMADPGTGDLRFNDATTASISQVAVSALSAATGNPDISSIITTWDDSTNTSNKGYLTFRKGGAPEVFATFIISGAITDNGTWLQIPVTYVGHNGSWTAADQMFSEFARSGDKGVDGAGDVTANTSSTSVDNEIALFSSTTGKVIKRATTTGMLKAVSGVLSAATAGTDFAKPDTASSWTAQQTFKELKDTVYTITDGADFEIDPANGSIQVVTLGANRTPAATNFEAGQTVLLGINDGTAYSITWTTVAPTWVKAGGTASAPTLATSGYTWVLLWKVSSTLYGTLVGSP